MTLIYVWIPFSTLPILAALQRIDHSLFEAAADLGAGPLHQFLRVTLPLSFPGVLAAFFMVFIPTVGEYVTPLLVGGSRGSMYGNIIQDFFTKAANWPLGSALSMIMLTATLLMVVLATRLIDLRGSGGMNAQRPAVPGLRLLPGPDRLALSPHRGSCSCSRSTPTRVFSVPAAGFYAGLVPEALSSSPEVLAAAAQQPGGGRGQQPGRHPARNDGLDPVRRAIEFRVKGMLGCARSSASRSFRMSSWGLRCCCSFRCCMCNARSGRLALPTR